MLEIVARRLGWLHHAPDQFEYIDIIGIVGLMKPAQPAGYSAGSHNAAEETNVREIFAY